MIIIFHSETGGAAANCADVSQKQAMLVFRLIRMLMNAAALPPPPPPRTLSRLRCAGPPLQAHDCTALSSSHAGTFNVLIPRHIAGDYLSKINQPLETAEIAAAFFLPLGEFSTNKVAHCIRGGGVGEWGGVSCTLAFQMWSDRRSIASSADAKAAKAL